MLEYSRSGAYCRMKLTPDSDSDSDSDGVCDEEEMGDGEREELAELLG